MSTEYRDFDWMNKKYTDEGLTMAEIAALCNVHPNTIWENLIRLKIQRRKQGPVEWSKETRLKILPHMIDRKPMLGKTHSSVTKKAMSEGRTGELNANWKGGITFNSRKFRKSRQYRLWRSAVLERDNHCCQYEGCGIKTNIVHHIKPAAENPELRVVESNGMAICSGHHKLIHKLLKNGTLKN